MLRRRAVHRHGSVAFASGLSRLQYTQTSKLPCSTRPRSGAASGCRSSATRALIPLGLRSGCGRRGLTQIKPAVSCRSENASVRPAPSVELLERLHARDGALTLSEKVAHLSRPESYPGKPAAVEVVQTHMSWVFLAGDRVYKLKKPVRYPFLDYSTAEARRESCEREVLLNRRLAGDIYRRVVPLTGWWRCAACRPTACWMRRYGRTRSARETSGASAACSAGFTGAHRRSPSARRDTAPDSSTASGPTAGSS